MEQRAEQAEAIIKAMEGVIPYTDHVKTAFDTYSFLKKFAGRQARAGADLEVEQGSSSQGGQKRCLAADPAWDAGDWLEHKAKQIQDPVARTVWLHVVAGAKAHLLKELEEGKFRSISSTSSS